MTAPGKLGRLRNDPSRPRLRLSRYLTGAVPAHPAAADYLARLSGWEMLGNDTQGDCVAVTWSNLRRLTTSYLSTEFYPPLPMVEQIYATQNPGGADNGMSIQTLLSYLVKTGGPDGAKAVGFAAVDYTNPEEVKAAIAIFGAVWVGFDVIQANLDEFSAGEPWDYASGSPDVGGHSVLVGGYGAESGPAALGGDEKFITWAQETSFTDLFWSKCVQECWVVIWPEHLGSKEFLAGVDLAAFAADYTAITGQPFPAPVPAPIPVPPGSFTPDAADKALARVGNGWARTPHIPAEGNQRMASAYERWQHAKGL